MGALVVLSTALATAVGTSAAVAAFANRSRGNFTNLGNEDVALGFWLRRSGELAKAAPWLNVTYVRDNSAIPMHHEYRTVKAPYRHQGGCAPGETPKGDGICVAPMLHDNVPHATRSFASTRHEATGAGDFSCAGIQFACSYSNHDHTLTTQKSGVDTEWSQ
eukprot:6736618-Prymnesium_polylepis.1